MKSVLVTLAVVAASAAALLWGMSTAAAQYSIQYSYGTPSYGYPQPIIVQAPSPTLPIQLPVDPPDCITVEQILAVLQMLQDGERAEREINRDLLRDVLERLAEQDRPDCVPGGGGAGGMILVQPASPFRCLQPIRNIGRAIALGSGWTPPARVQLGYAIPFR